MSPEKWQKIKDILENALEIPDAEREKFLENSCNGDAELRLEVEKFLALETPGDDLLENTAFSVVSENGNNPVGQKIGNYEVIEEIGAGGMGAVFLAVRADGAFEQKAALKLIKRGMDSDAILRRFYNERQILASLEHPNIAHLLDGGTSEDGLPYFVMEYVAGDTIIEYARRENLDLDDRLNLFRKVCAAVSFAHRNLIIHRDLKPSNILVGKDGEVKLLDFGIAKLLKNDADDSTTATQMQVFTPEYASPEQILNEKLTTASDVYSLGVILYELLTGNRPYKTESKNISEIIKAVCETEPVRPSTTIQEEEKRRRGEEESGEFSSTFSPSPFLPFSPSQLKGDLDNIILKSLRKEPERRYSSVEQFAEDIRRHQAGLPVTASRDTWSYRASKFIRRNKIAAAAAVLILVTLLAGLFATLYQRNKAQRRFNDVRVLANSFLFEFHDSIKDLPGSTHARELVVRRALEYLDKLAAESEDDLTLQRELGAAYAKIGEIQGNSYFPNLGDTEGAMQSYRRSLEIREKIAATDPQNVEYRHELADSYEGVGDMFYTIGELENGLESYEKALAIREKIAAEEPANLAYKYSLANILGKRGDIKGMEGFQNLGDTIGALESYNRVIPLYEELVHAAPDDEKFKLGYATALHFAGMLKSTTGDRQGAIANGEKAVSIMESLIAAAPDNQKYETHLMSALVFLRFPLLEEGRTVEAVNNARRVVGAMEKQSAADPKNHFARRGLSVSYNSLGICLVQAGDYAGAIENHRKSLKIAEELLAADTTNGERRRDVSVTLEYLANAQLKAGDFNSALGNYRKAFSMLDTDSASAEYKADTPAALYLGIARANAAQGDLKQASENILRAVPLAEQAAQSAPANIKLQTRLAETYLEAGRILKQNKNEAYGFYRKSLDIWNRMQQAGTLSRINENRPNEVSRELGGYQ